MCVCVCVCDLLQDKMTKRKKVGKDQECFIQNGQVNMNDTDCSQYKVYVSAELSTTVKEYNTNRLQ